LWKRKEVRQYYISTKSRTIPSFYDAIFKQVFDKKSAFSRKGFYKLW